MTSFETGAAMKPLWQWDFVDPGPVPDVSVIIPVHGNIAMTMRCLWSIHEAQHLNAARVEVIVVDDASPDHSRSTLTQLRGLTVVALDDNVGYLRATNAGIAAAHGRHIHLLNNDTLVVGTWIDALLDTMKRRNALVVGSKLVYLDGIVQEAGGVIFNDGSGWNYGRRREPDDPAVTYERRVDYCSAASLLVNGEFLRTRGGFDERYVPAYYEDTDLCFSARETGGEVWFQPESVVVHLEGQSHGTDESSGIKAYQAVNRERFVERHAAALTSQRSPSREDSELGRERVRGRIIVVDNEVPTADRDSGSLRLFSLMKAMVDGGWGVTFLPANGWRREPYTSRLERAGVEVLGTSDQWWQRIEAMSSTVTHVWLSRPNVTAEFLERFRTELPHARIIYDTVDLHYVREARRAEVTGDQSFATKSSRLREVELGSMARADDVVVVSPIEQRILRESEGISSIVIPNVHPRIDAWPVPEGRDGILFVGSFRHPPNVDAVMWMVNEILPVVRESRPDVEFRIVGSHAPAQILALADQPGVRLLGWVPDIAPIYAAAKVTVAPLRFGAGLKGKVGEAMSLGVPMVMTSTAAEGMTLEPGRHAIVADESLAFANGIGQLLDDDEVWRTMSRASRELIDQWYSPEVVGAHVCALLEGTEPAGVAEPDAVMPDEMSLSELVAQLHIDNVRLRGELVAHREVTADFTRQAEALRREIIALENEPITVMAASDSAVAVIEAYERDQLAAALASVLQQSASARFATQGRTYRLAQRLASTLRRLLKRAEPSPGGADVQHLALLAQSGLIDADWYRATYPDIVEANLDPFDHYTTQGWREGRSPGPLFDSAWYLATYPDIAAAGMDPALHYAVWGWREGKRPTMWFDPLVYAQRHGLVGTDVSPVVHFAAMRRARAELAARSLTEPAVEAPRDEDASEPLVVRRGDHRRAVLHIGIEGSGTTYLQRDLAVNAALLAEAGWAYPTFLDEINQHQLAAFAVEPTPVRDFHDWHGVTAESWDAYRQSFANTFILETQAADRWLFTNEHLSTWADEQAVRRLADLFDQAGLNLTVVMYVRRQDHLIPSTYSTAVKWGWPQHFDLDHFIDSRERYDFDALFDRWNSVLPGRVQVRPYLEHQVTEWITEDFGTEVLGIGEQWWPFWIHPDWRINTSLSVTDLEFLRRANEALGDTQINRNERRRLIEGLARESDGDRFTLTPSQAAQVLAAYDASNRSLCSKAEVRGLSDVLAVQPLQQGLAAS